MAKLRGFGTASLQLPLGYSTDSSYHLSLVVFCGHLKSEASTFAENKQPSLTFEVAKTDYATWFTLDDPSKGCSPPPSDISYNLYSDDLCTTQQEILGRIEIIADILTFTGGATEVGLPETIYMCA